MSEKRPVTPEALDRVEKKLDIFAQEQKKVNERVFDTMEQLNKTLASLDKNIALSTQKFTLVHEKSRHIEKKTDKLEQDVEKLKLDNRSIYTSVKVTKWIMFSAIPLIITLFISVVRSLV